MPIYKSLNPLCFNSFIKSIQGPVKIMGMDINFKTQTHFKSSLKHELTENAVTGSDQKNAKLDLTDEQKNQLILKKKKKEEDKKEKAKCIEKKDLTNEDKKIDKKNILFII